MRRAHQPALPNNPRDVSGPAIADKHPHHQRMGGRQGLSAAASGPPAAPAPPAAEWPQTRHLQGARAWGGIARGTQERAARSRPGHGTSCIPFPTLAWARQGPAALLPTQRPRPVPDRCWGSGALASSMVSCSAASSRRRSSVSASPTQASTSKSSQPSTRSRQRGVRGPPPANPRGGPPSEPSSSSDSGSRGSTASSEATRHTAAGAASVQDLTSDSVGGVCRRAQGRQATCARGRRARAGWGLDLLRSPPTDRRATRPGSRNPGPRFPGRA